jgi:hypothetical protein
MTRLRLILLSMAIAAVLLVGTASAALAGVDNQQGPGFEHQSIALAGISLNALD